jgi:hypothetical protein
MSNNNLQWMIQGQGHFRMCGPTVKTLPAGAYTCYQDCYGNLDLVQKHLEVDDLVDFADSLPSRILHEIDHFWKQGDSFRRYGFLHRRGYLLYGKQGGGKSSVIHQVVSRIVAAGHVAFFCEQPQVFIHCMSQFRNVESDRPMVCIFEDIDATIEHFGDSDLLQWLDGNHQVNKAVNLATTNYPEKLDRRIVSRPRRFDRIFRIDAPDARLRTAYFARKMPDQSTVERAKWVELSEGLQFAALAEMVIGVKCLGNDLEQTVKVLREMDIHNPSSEEFNPPPTLQSNGVPATNGESAIPF